jgi:hypothetical protein
MSENGHSCPGCRQQYVSDSMGACRDCWFRLPTGVRQDIWREYRRARGGTEHMRALGKAMQWYRDNPLP